MKIKRIKDTIYNRDITMIYECSQEEFYLHLEKKHKGIKLGRRFTYAEHISITNPDTWDRHYIWIKRNEFYIKDYGVLIHEVFHVCRECFDEIGMKINEETNEAFAYYQEYVFEKVLRILLAKKSRDVE